MPSDGGIKAADGDNIFPEGGIMSLEGAGGIVNSESATSQLAGHLRRAAFYLLRAAFYLLRAA